MFPTWPKQQPLDQSVPRQIGVFPPDLNRELRIRVFRAGPQPQRISEDIPDRMPERMSEDMPDTYARKNVIRDGIFQVLSGKIWANNRWNEMNSRVSWASVSQKTLFQTKQRCESCNGTCSWGFVLEHGMLWNAMVGITRSKVILDVPQVLRQNHLFKMTHNSFGWNPESFALRTPHIFCEHRKQHVSKCVCVVFCVFYPF